MTFSLEALELVLLTQRPGVQRPGAIGINIKDFRVRILLSLILFLINLFKNKTCLCMVLLPQAGTFCIGMQSKGLNTSSGRCSLTV
jgi:hypothetical protein